MIPSVQIQVLSEGFSEQSQFPGWSIGVHDISVSMETKTLKARMFRSASAISETAVLILGFVAVTTERDQEMEGLNAKCEGLRSALQAQERHAEALDRELDSRPTASQVFFLRMVSRHP